VKTDIETLITALYVKIDDELVTNRWCGRPPPQSGTGLPGGGPGTAAGAQQGTLAAFVG